MIKGNVLIRFRHPSKDLTYISSLLDLPCSRSWIAGAPRMTPTGEPLSGTNPDSYWSTELKFPSESGFGEQLRFAINRLKDNEKDLHDFKESGGKVEIYLQLPGSINNGDTIESVDIKKIVGIGVDLLIEVFPDM